MLCIEYCEYANVEALVKSLTVIAEYTKQIMIYFYSSFETLYKLSLKACYRIPVYAREAVLEREAEMCILKPKHIPCPMI